MALVITGMTTLVLVLTVVLANAEVRRTSRDAAEDRLRSVVDQLASLASNSAEQRLRLKREVGSSPVLASALRGEAVSPEALVEALSTMRAASDSGLPVQLRDRRGEIVFTDLPVSGAAEARFQPLVPLDTVPAYGAFHRRDGETRYYSTAPVTQNGVVLGWVVQQRRMGSPRTAQDLERLIGSNSRVLFWFEGDSIWITLAGDVVQAPRVAEVSDSTVLVADENGERFLVRGAEVRAAPWRVIVEMPESVIHASSAHFLRRMALAGVLLILVFTAAGWLLSRRLTDPLRDLAAASDAMAAGDYTRRVPEQRGDELGRLATAFNAMSAQIAASHQALHQQLAEANTLARELELANIEAERSREESERAARAKSDFLATMSHEIRTPINAVLGFCQLMELSGLDDATRRDYLGRTQRAARQLATLVDDVLDLAKVDSGRIRVETADTPVLDTVATVVALLEDESRTRNLHIDISVGADLTVHADPQRLEQILLNLVSNAVKFTPPGGSIRVHAEPAGAGEERVRVHVEDSGIGIAPEELERIFEPFVQAQSGYTREYGGTGLGLSISRRLARLMGGDVVVVSEPGRGSTFTVLLPATAPEPAAAAS